MPDANTNRSEKSTEFVVRDAMRIGEHRQLRAGLRHTRLQHQAERTSPSSDGLQRTAYGQGLTAPGLAASYALAPQTLAYASWGQGLESDVAPDRARYVNAGQPLPALKSRQFEAGLKHDGEIIDASVAYFDIDRPLAVDRGTCSAAGSCRRAIDGSERHRGIEAAAALHIAAWTWQASAMLLDAERQGATAQAQANGQRPVNVPQATLRLGAEYRVPPLPGLALLANLSVEGDRVVLPCDTAVRIPG